MIERFYISESMRLKNIFSSSPRQFVVICNQIATSIDFYDPGVIALLDQSNEHLFVGMLMTSKCLQLLGIYNGKHIKPKI